uniref:PARP catalytic domain-containing protein n=1 Tax=Elaeophora elaphi TaxID=1147741 RepID=A0A0R3RIF9_9BILA
MINEKDRYGSGGAFARSITAKQRSGSKPRLFYPLGSNYSSKTSYQKSDHHFVCKSPQLSIGISCILAIKSCTDIVVFRVYLRQANEDAKIY